MNDLILNKAPTMSSREIAELCDITHDSVLKTIRALIDRGIVSGNDTLFFYTHPQNVWRNLSSCRQLD
jgi:phage regulator Rha-like protein